MAKQLVYQCLNCNESFISEHKIKDTIHQLCPYCHVVKFGEPDIEWIPSVKRDDLERQGFHKV